MTLDLASTGRAPIAQAQDSTGHTTFAVRVHGALAKSAVAEHTVLVRGYTDGIECSAFGQATVAVVGHSVDGFAIVLTNRGPLQLADTTLRVGCPGCAVVRDIASGQVVGRLRTPGWDLTLANLRPDSLFVTVHGELAVRRGSSAVVLPLSGPFRVVTDVRSSTEHRLELNSGACT